jgi:hypothetical protein
LPVMLLVRTTCGSWWVWLKESVDGVGQRGTLTAYGSIHDLRFTIHGAEASEEPPLLSSSIQDSPFTIHLRRFLLPVTCHLSPVTIVRFICIYLSKAPERIGRRTTEDSAGDLERPAAFTASSRTGQW